jgi:hypothetical protein
LHRKGAPSGVPKNKPGRRAHRYAEGGGSSMWAGNLGTDLLNQAQALTLDFRAPCRSNWKNILP